MILNQQYALSLNKAVMWLWIQSSQVSLHMQRQVVGAGEGAFTHVALERPMAGVFTEMTRQLVGAGEFPSASLPVAVVRFFTWWCKAMGLVLLVLKHKCMLKTNSKCALTGVGSVMRLQMRALGVGLAAAGIGAGVRRSALPRPGASPSLGFGLH